jgi:hypothetical protein
MAADERRYTQISIFVLSAFISVHQRLNMFFYQRWWTAARILAL